MYPLVERECLPHRRRALTSSFQLLVFRRPFFDFSASLLIPHICSPTKSSNIGRRHRRSTRNNTANFFTGKTNFRLLLPRLLLFCQPAVTYNLPLSTFPPQAFFSFLHLSATCSQSKLVSEAILSLDFTRQSDYTKGPFCNLAPICQSWAELCEAKHLPWMVFHPIFFLLSLCCDCLPIDR